MKRAAACLLIIFSTACMHVYQPDGTIKVQSALATTELHVFAWDYIPHVGWRHTSPYGQSQAQCFDEDGSVLLACAACYDASKRLRPGCIAGFYDNAPAACRSFYQPDDVKVAACVAGWPK